MVKLNRSIFAGFTLVETLISIAIFAIITGVIYLFFMVGIGSWEIGTVRTELQGHARNATDFMVGELKNATRNHSTRDITILAPPNNTDITFYLPEVDAAGDVIIDTNGQIKWPDNDADFIKYEYLAATNQLVRKEGSQQRILANNVSNVEFIDASIDGSLFMDELNITLSLDKTTPRGRNLFFTMRSTVKLRN